MVTLFDSIAGPSSRGPALHFLLESLIAVLYGLALLSVFYTLFASRCVARFLNRKVDSPSRPHPITIIKPLHGIEHNLLANLRSFFEQDHNGDIQHLFGVHDENDKALVVVEQIRALYPHADINVVIDPRLYGPNRKVANLANMLPKAKHNLLCFADSDVYVDKSYLRAVTGAIEQPGIGLVTCAYRGAYTSSFWSRGSVAATNYHFLPGVATGLTVGMAKPCFGQTIALTRETLDRIGGLTQFSHHLAEDHALGQAVRDAGKTVSISPQLVWHTSNENSLGSLFTHELRWSRTIRAVDRVGHLGSILMYPTPLAVTLLIASLGSMAAWIVLVLSILCRQLLRWRVDQTSTVPAGKWWLLPVWDMLQFVIFITSFLSSDVTWKGRRFRVNADGLLSERPSPNATTAGENNHRM